ncbi:MAG TPA: EAL domain-containing protein [Pseudomonadales bacterium]|nr:EAL domain-containing protein [Pseudomonadales bacterium]
MPLETARLDDSAEPAMAPLRREFLLQLDMRGQELEQEWAALQQHEFGVHLVQAFTRRIHQLSERAALYGLPELTHIAQDIESTLITTVRNRAKPDQILISFIDDRLQAIRRMSSQAGLMQQTLPELATDDYPVIYVLDGQQRLGNELIRQLSTYRWRGALVSSFSELRHLLQAKPGDGVIVVSDIPSAQIAAADLATEIEQLAQHAPVWLWSSSDAPETRLWALRCGCVAAVSGWKELSSSIAEMVWSNAGHLRVAMLGQKKGLPYGFDHSLLTRSWRVEWFGNIAMLLDRLLSEEFDCILINSCEEFTCALEVAELIKQYPSLDMLPILVLLPHPDLEEYLRASCYRSIDIIASPVTAEYLLTFIENRAFAYRRSAARHRFLSSVATESGFFTRPFFLEEMQKALTLNRLSPAACIYIEFDQPMVVPTAGVAKKLDELRQRCFRVVTHQAEIGDLIAQFSDNAIALMARRDNVEAVRALADSLYREFLRETDNTGITLFSARMGLTLLEGLDAEKVLTDAQASCAAAKSYSGMKVALHPNVRSQETEQSQSKYWLQQLRTAISESRVMLAYQPVMHLQGDGRARYEVFFRLFDAQQNMIMPRQFISTARQHGLMRYLDRWVLGASVKALANHQHRDLDVSFFVKVSADTFTDPGFIELLGSQLAPLNLQPHSLVLEFAETDVVANASLFACLVPQLKALRVGRCIEHFGRNEFAIEMLDAMDVDYIRFNALLGQDVDTDKYRLIELKRLVDAARAREINTIIGYVEKSSILARAYSLGIDFAQGDFIGSAAATLDFDFSHELA